MKLIHRVELELTHGQRVKADCEMTITASFYRPFLDGGYKVMVAHMMDTGCFDGFMKSVLDQLLKPGIFKEEKNGFKGVLLVFYLILIYQPADWYRFLTRF